MKVIQVIPGQEEGNSMIFSKRQTKEIEDLGVTTRYFFFHTRQSLFSMIREAKKFRKLIREFNPDIIHCHYGTISAFFCAFTNAKPLVITFHGSDLNFLKYRNILTEIFSKTLSQLAALRAKKMICVSEKLKMKLWWKKNHVEIIPMGVDIALFPVMDQAEARKILNFDLNQKIILFNASNPKVKRLDIAQKTIKLLQQKMPNARLEILGGQVQLESMVYLLNASDCLLMCSDSEGSPTMIKEAMACNLPIVANDVGDIQEMIAQTSPYVISAQEPESLAQGLFQVIQKQQRSNGRQILESRKLTQKNLCMKTVDLYNKILNT